MSKESNNSTLKKAFDDFMSSVQKLKRKADIELIKDQRALEITNKLNALRGEMTSAQWAIFIYVVMKELDLVNFFKDGVLDLRKLREGLDGANASRIKREFEEEMECINQKIKDYERAVGANETCTQ